MIASLRRRHALMWSVLAGTLPLAFATGLLGRTRTAVMDALPAGLAGAPVAALNPQAAIARVPFAGRPDDALQVWHGIGTGNVTQLEMIGPDAPAADRLLYWAPSPADRPVTGLSAQARLLGAWEPGAFLAWPEDLPAADGVEGRFMIYSLVDQEVIATSLAPVKQAVMRAGNGGS